jgi:hypothetical protein
MSVDAFINRIVEEVVRFVTADPLAWLGGGAKADLAALAANPAVRDTADVAQITAVFLCAIFMLIIGFTTVWRKALLSPAAVAAPGGAGAAPAAPAGPLRARWEALTARLDSPRESDWKVAVIEADTFMDEALARAGFPGDTFGDRLMNMEPGALQSLDGVWWAHKVRNRLAHESDYFLRYTEAKQAVNYFHQALEELRLI